MHDVDLLIVSSGHAFFMMGWRSRLREATENNEQGSGSCMREAQNAKGIMAPSELFAALFPLSRLATVGFGVFLFAGVHYITLYLVPPCMTRRPVTLSF